jgi:hypothetical protein
VFGYGQQIHDTKCIQFMGGGNSSDIIVEFMSAEWLILQPLYMSLPKKVEWRMHCEQYLEIWISLNSRGSVDRKHVHIKFFPKLGSLYFIYRCHILVVLLACVDAIA